MNKKMLMNATFIVAISTSTGATAGLFDKLGDVLEKNTSSSSSSSPAASNLSNIDISQAFKQALSLGSATVVKQLSQTGGFTNDSAIRIPLPSKLEKARSLLKTVGMEATLDDLALKLNSAAEQATPKAKALFVDAIKQMSFKDVRTIYSGPSDAATQYFRSKMTPKLTSEMTPVVSKSLSDVGAVKRYDEMLGAYKDIPFVPDIKTDLTQHVVNGGLDGIFHYLAEQEASIRKDPVKQTTALLKKVFGSR